MPYLAINVDHVATIRQARGGVEPDPVQAAGICELAGADGIVVHLREDRRHIQDRDVRILRETVKTKLNLEMAVTPEMVDIGCRLRPADVCLVPERRQELTTEGGLDAAGNAAAVGEAVRRLAAAGVRVSLFIDPEPTQIEAARRLGAPVIEIHTGRYADADDAATRAAELERVRAGAALATSLGLVVNAGHGLTVENVGRIAAIPAMDELNIGHSLVARALFIGLEAAVREMKAAMLAAAGAERGRG